jgi:hypothetical protein
MNKELAKILDDLSDPSVLGVTDICKVADDIDGRFLLMDNGRIEFVIIIDEHTQSIKYRNAWIDIDITRQDLFKMQGSNMNFEATENRVMYDFARMKTNGFSYTDIALNVNFDLAFFLTHWADNFNERGCTFGILNINILFRLFNINYEDGIQWLTYGFMEIRDGRAPWSPDSGPVSRQQVIDAIRRWKHSLNNGKIILRSESYERVLPYFVLNKIIGSSSWSHTIQLISSTFPASWKKYEEKFEQQIAEVNKLYRDKS